MFTVAASAAEGDDAANTVTVDGVKYEVNVGDTFTYYYYLNVSEITQDTFKPGRIINIEGSTYYDDSIIKVTNWVEDEDGFYSDMFPVLYNAGLVSNQLDDEMTYNASNLNGIRFDKDGRAVIKMDCEVIAEGSTEINTIIKNSQKFGPTGPEDDLVIVIEDGVFKAEPWAVKEEVVGLEPPATEAPTDAPATEAPTDAPATEAPTEAFDPADHTWTAVGAIAPGHVDGGIFGTAWTPANTDNDLTFDEATGLWSITYTDVAATGETEDYDDTYYEYKVAADHAWDLSFNDKGNALGDGTNAQFDVAVDGSTVTIFFDGTKCWAEVVAPEVPTETEAPTDAPATEAPTDAPANDLYIRLENDDNQLYPVVKGEKYRYTFYMTVPAKIGSFDASTWYDVDGLKVCPIVDEYGDDDLAAMFPGFAGNVVANLTGEAANGEILYNHSSVGGFRFNDEKAVFTVDFEVTADTGIFDIWTQIRTVADTDMNKYYQYGEKLMDGCEFRSDLNGYFPTPDTQAPATEAPTDAPVTEAPTDAPVTEAPTEAPKKVYIRVDNDDEKVYEVETGKTYTYEYFLACDQKISSLDCTTWFDTEGLDFVPAVDEYGDPTGTEMPNLPAPVYNYDIDGEILYNFSNVAGVRFPVPADGAMVEKNVVFRGQFTVTAEEGVYDIWTDLKVLGDTNNDKIIFGSEQVNPDVTVIEEERIADLVPGTLPEIPTDAPATEAPTDAPVTEAPTDAPEVPTDAPATDAPEVPTDAPATEAPTDAPEQPEETEEPSEEEPSDEPVDEPDDDATADEPGPATSGQSSTGDSKNPANSNAVKTGSTAAAIAFLTVLVMAAGVVMFARKRKFN